MNNRGVSQIVGVAVLIGLTVALVAAVWGILNAFVLDRLDTAEACNQILDKVSFNNEYVCHNVTDGGNYTLVSVNIADIDVDEILISVNYENENKVIRLTNQSRAIDGVTYYQSSLTEVSMPSKEGGRTYVVESNEKPESIEVSPKIKGVQCDITDKIESIPNCIN